jgi:hypothetical protein
LNFAATPATSLKNSTTCSTRLSATVPGSAAWFRLGGTAPGLSSGTRSAAADSVGDKRFRPTLEDLVEFLIAEKLAQPKPGWEKAIADVS